MSRRMIGLLLVVVTACALVGVARQVPAEAARPGVAASLPVTPAAEVPVCGGPETLQVPDGAAPVPVPGPLALAGLAALPSALPATVGDDTPSTGAAGPAAPAATLGPLTAGGHRPTAPASPSPASPSPSPATTAATGTAAATGPAGPVVRVVGATPSQAGAWRLDVRHVNEVPVVAASQWTLATMGDLRGLATATCAPGATDTWLLGGTTLPGHRMRLLLANPGVSPSVVDLTILGPQGVVQAPAGTGVTVAPGTQRAVYLDALAPGLPALAVHVTARTGRVAATLHVTVVRGLVPGGADDVPAAAAPARRQVIPGLAVAAPISGAQVGQLPLSPSAAGAVAVRVAAPGGSEAVVRVHLYGPDGEVNLPGGGVTTVAARSVVDLPVTGVPDGIYAAVVDADSPIVATAVVGRTKPGGELAGTAAAATGGVPLAELAWTAAGRPLQATTAIAFPPASAFASAGNAGRPGGPPAVTARLSLAALGGKAGRVVLAEVGADGSAAPARAVDVPAGSSVTVDVAPGAAGMLLRAAPGAGPVVAAVVLTATDAAGGLISVQSVRPGSQTAGDAPTVVQDPRLGLASQSSSR